MTKRPKTEKKLPSHNVFIVDGDGDKAFWTKIGGAWAHEDGEGFTLSLIAMPLTGRIVVRKVKPPEGQEAAGAKQD